MKFKCSNFQDLQIKFNKDYHTGETPYLEFDIDFYDIDEECRYELECFFSTSVFEKNLKITQLKRELYRREEIIRELNKKEIRRRG
jgi:hypothetical protein